MTLILWSLCNPCVFHGQRISIQNSHTPRLKSNLEPWLPPWRAKFCIYNPPRNCHFCALDFLGKIARCVSYLSGSIFHTIVPAPELLTLILVLRGLSCWPLLRFFVSRCCLLTTPVLVSWLSALTSQRSHLLMFGLHWPQYAAVAPPVCLWNTVSSPSFVFVTSYYPDFSTCLRPPGESTLWSGKHDVCLVHGFIPGHNAWHEEKKKKVLNKYLLLSIQNIIFKNFLGPLGYMIRALLSFWISANACPLPVSRLVFPRNLSLS